MGLTQKEVQPGHDTRLQLSGFCRCRNAREAKQPLAASCVPAGRGVVGEGVGASDEVGPAREWLLGFLRPVSWCIEGLALGGGRQRLSGSKRAEKRCPAQRGKP